MKSTCPQDSVLQDFAHGRSADSEIQMVAAHLEECSLCEHRLQELENASDELCGSIRQAAKRGDDDDELERLVAEAAIGLLPPPGAQREVCAESNGKRAIPFPPRLAQYELGERIGRGGMGEVYKAVHTSLKRPVAVKFIANHRLNDSAAVPRFYREMEAVGHLDHPNIVRAHDAGECDGHHFLVMEFVDGSNLGDIVRDKGPLSVAAACSVCRQAAMGLACAHQMGLVHRDVKPSNLMLSANGVVKVLDLGLARFARDTTFLCEVEQIIVNAAGNRVNEPDLTGHGQVLGSPGFVAPEQVSDSRGADHRVDIFSLGATLFYLLTASRPFPCDGKSSRLAAISAKEVEQLLVTLPDSVPKELRHLIQRMMSPDVTKRPSDMNEVAVALSQFSENAEAVPPLGRSAAAEVTAINRQKMLPLPSGWSRLKIRRLAMLVGVVTFAGIAVFLAFKQRYGKSSVAKPPIERRIIPPRVSADTRQQIVNSIGMRLAPIPAGEFLMGSPVDESKREVVEGPQHLVRITRPFFIGVHEVTQAEYKRVMNKNPSFYCRSGGGASWVKGLDTDRLPVESVHWKDATAFCASLSALPEEVKAGRKYRLPTEAEWEYACRAGTTGPFHFGSTLSSLQANFKGSIPYGGAAKGRFLGRPSPVGSYPPNGFGLFDMHGNVWEWCQDWYSPEYYAGSPSDDPHGPASGSRRVMRGGGWGVSAMLCRSAHRNAKVEPIDYLYSSGFRVVMEIDQNPESTP